MSEYSEEVTIENDQKENDNPVHRLARKLNWPYELAKAACDPFSYEIRLRDGTVIEFEEADALSADWIRIKRITAMTKDRIDCQKYYERGLAIKVADIMCVADAPDGKPACQSIY